MSALETFYLRGAAAVVLAYVAFVLTVITGGNAADLSPNTLLAVLVVYGLGLAGILGGLWALAMKTDGASRTRADERESLIEAKADRTGYRILDAGLLALTVVVVLESDAGDPGPSRLEHGVFLVLVLVSLSAFAGLARMLAGFMAARRG